MPFERARFDVVFTCAVLEHVPHLLELLGEVRRVLRPGGRAVHVVPAVAWRFWTLVTHGPVTVRQIARSGRLRDLASGARQLLAPHGEYRSSLHELVAWRRSQWKRTFERAGFTVESVDGTGIYDSGNALFPALSVAARTRLAPVLGSACVIFSTRDAAAAAG